MRRKRIVNTASEEEVPPRVFDLLVEEGEEAYLEVKLGKNTFEKIPWDLVCSQVNSEINRNA